MSAAALIIGSNGMLAADLAVRLVHAGFRVEGRDLPDIDITDRETVTAALENIHPDIVINCAAYTAVDKAESEPDKAFAVNRDGPANIADACANADVPLIHISTDFVFDGTAHTPYTEDDTPTPTSVYGTSKYAGEQVANARHCATLIVRTSWLYGVHGGNFVTTHAAAGARTS